MYKKSAPGWRKHFDFIILDIFCLHIAFVLAYAVRHGHWKLYADKNYLSIAVIMTILDALIAIVFTSFKNVLKRGYFKEFVAAFKHVCLLESGTLIYLFSIQQGDIYSRITFYLFPVFYIVITTFARYGLKYWLRKRKRLTGARSLLLVTTKELAKECVIGLNEHNYATYNLQGISIMDESCVGAEIQGVSVVADFKDVLDYVRTEWVDAVMICVPPEMSYPAGLAKDFQKMGVIVHRVIAKKEDDTEYRQQIERVGSFTVLSTSMNYATSEKLFVKRLLDIIGGIVGCIFAGIICVVFGTVIYIKSPGPILFTQTRVGRNGKQFKIYKLRTMYLDAEERKAELMAENRVKDGMMFKLDYDPRIIGNRKTLDGTIKKGIGSFLRESSLDEFPQFFNVLKGEMSLVGTRPPTVDEWERYELHHRARLAIKPGLTGMWQVSGRSNITDFEEVVKLDTQYISEWSLGLDLKILVKTVLVVFGRIGAM